MYQRNIYTIQIIFEYFTKNSDKKDYICICEVWNAWEIIEQIERGEAGTGDWYCNCN